MGLLLLAAPACAQMPNAGDTAPAAPPPPVTTPAAPPTPQPPAAGASPALASVVFDGIIFSGPLNHLHADHIDAVYGGELTFQADRGGSDLRAGRKDYTLSGHIHVHEADTTLRAGEVTFNGNTEEASATDAVVNQKMFTVRSARLEKTAEQPGGTPEQLIATDADVSTVPPGVKADFHLHAQTITLDPAARKGVLRNATVYLFGTRLLTIPRVTFRLGAGGGDAARRTALLPTVGVSARYGTYLAFGSGLRVGSAPVQYRVLLPTHQTVEATLTSQQTLYTPPAPAAPPSAAQAGPKTLLERLRVFATAPPPVLPDGDPLRFHDFLPERNPIRLFSAPSRGGLGLAEELSSHVAASGRLRDDLYVSRLPEVTLRGDIPLTRLPAPPAYGDPEAFRTALRHLVFYAEAQETVGQYREQPTNVNASRTRAQLGFSAYPLLVAPNTVFLPRVLISTSSYSGSKKAYRYDQLDVALNHYFSDLTAVGVQFLASNTGGDSPFDFDVLDTTREIDLRLQMGGQRLITAGRVRYDLSHHGVIDYQLAVAPALNGFIPVFSYNFRTRTIGISAEIKGVTF